eukprot:gene23180-28051_t
MEELNGQEATLNEAVCALPAVVTALGSDATVSEVLGRLYVKCGEQALTRALEQVGGVDGWLRALQCVHLVPRDAAADSQLRVILAPDCDDYPVALMTSPGHAEPQEDVLINFDGSGSGGHREHCGAAAVIQWRDEQEHEIVMAQLPPRASHTSKVCEWMGLLLGLWRLQSLSGGGGVLHVKGDNASLIKMLDPERHIESIKKFEVPLWKEARRLLHAWSGRVFCTWVPREENDAADRAANTARAFGSSPPEHALHLLDTVYAAWTAWSELKSSELPQKRPPSALAEEKQRLRKNAKAERKRERKHVAAQNDFSPASHISEE